MLSQAEGLTLIEVLRRTSSSHASAASAASSAERAAATDARSAFLRDNPILRPRGRAAAAAAAAATAAAHAHADESTRRAYPGP